MDVEGTTAAEIAESLELAIDRGHLRPGDQLPTVRGLAEELGVSPVTIAMAFRSLRQRGLVIGEGRRGTRVRAGGKHYLSVTPVPEGVRNLALGNPDPDFVASLARGLRAVDPTPSLYGVRANLPELVDVIRTQLREDGIARDRIAVVSGALDGIERVLVAACRPGDRIIVEDPCINQVLYLARALGLQLVPVTVDDHGVQPDSLERALRTSVRAALFTPRAQNPIGGYVDNGRARELRRVLDHYPKVLVVEDDYAGPVAGVPLETLTVKRARWAHVRSFSKVLGPDLRVAFVAGDEATLARVEFRQRLGTGWVSTILQRIALELLTEPAAVRLLARAEQAYTVRRQAMLRALAAHGIEAFGRSGLNVWVPVVEEVSVVRALLDAGWAVSAGERFRIDSPPGIRITIATLKEGEAEAVASSIAASMQTLAWTQAG